MRLKLDRDGYPARYFVLLSVVILAGCVIPPVVYQENLPASIPNGGDPEARVAYDAYSWDQSTWAFAGSHVLGGVRWGQHYRGWTFEQGASFLYGSTFLAGVSGGIGLDNPTITLRTSLYVVGSGAMLGNPWWQVSLAGGNPEPLAGPAWSLGVATSQWGIGPQAGLDYYTGSLRVGGQASTFFRTFWAPTSVSGTVVALGFCVARRGGRGPASR